jgi:hypothetical protein
MPLRSERRHHIRAGILSLFIITVGLNETALVGQDNGGFRLVVLPHSIGLAYTPPTGTYVFFVGEPVPVAIRLLNHTTDELSLTPDRSLERQVTKTLRRRGEQQALPGVEWPRIESYHLFDGTSTVPGDNYAEVRYSLTAQGRSLQPGVYEVSALYPLRPGFNLTAKETIEVRVPESRSDQMDMLLHTAIRARWDGDLQGAHAALTSLLALNPVSANGYAELGAVFVASRDCVAARKAYDQAVAIIESGSDRENARARNHASLSDWAHTLKILGQRCG